MYNALKKLTAIINSFLQDDGMPFLLAKVLCANTVKWNGRGLPDQFCETTLRHSVVWKLHCWVSFPFNCYTYNILFCQSRRYCNTKTKLRVIGGSLHCDISHIRHEWCGQPSSVAHCQALNRWSALSWHHNGHHFSLKVLTDTCTYLVELVFTCIVSTGLEGLVCVSIPIRTLLVRILGFHGLLDLRFTAIFQRSNSTQLNSAQLDSFTLVPMY